MSNNKAIFLQQQREAFYFHHIDQMTPKDLEQLIGKLKSKKPSQFPPPEYIFSKPFAFLNGALAEIQKKQIPKRILATDSSTKDKAKEEGAGPAAPSTEPTKTGPEATKDQAPQQPPQQQTKPVCKNLVP